MTKVELVINTFDEIPEFWKERCSGRFNDPQTKYYILFENQTVLVLDEPTVDGIGASLKNMYENR